VSGGIVLNAIGANRPQPLWRIGRRPSRHNKGRTPAGPYSSHPRTKERRAEAFEAYLYMPGPATVALPLQSSTNHGFPRRDGGAPGAAMVLHRDQLSSRSWLRGARSRKRRGYGKFDGKPFRDDGGRDTGAAGFINGSAREPTIRLDRRFDAGLRAKGAGLRQGPQNRRHGAGRWGGGINLVFSVGVAASRFFGPVVDFRPAGRSHGRGGTGAAGAGAFRDARSGGIARRSCAWMPKNDCPRPIAAQGGLRQRQKGEAWATGGGGKINRTFSANSEIRTNHCAAGHLLGSRTRAVWSGANRRRGVSF